MVGSWADASSRPFSVEHFIVESLNPVVDEKDITWKAVNWKKIVDLLIKTTTSRLEIKESPTSALAGIWILSYKFVAPGRKQVTMLVASIQIGWGS